MITGSRLRTALKNGQALKVISGLTNFDQDRVAATVKAATLGGATFLDIAADPSLVEMARSLTDLPICVSAIEPAKFVPAVEDEATATTAEDHDTSIDITRSEFLQSVGFS